MKIYLIRHGLAEEQDEHEDDTSRPLTPEGVKKTQQVAKHLKELKMKFDLILTSPLLRAQQTAKILEEEKLSTTLQVADYLAPNQEIEAWVTWLESWKDRKDESSLALVGHQPGLGNWAEMLVYGIVKDGLVLKKAGLIGLLLPNNGTPVGRSQLFWLTSPKLLLG